MKTVKSIGVTPTERLLANLCEQSFLKLWTYPSPFKEDGKELCDLLVVFENHVLIFFDRESRKLDDQDIDLGIRWNRWKKTVIDNQIRTAHGAERYIRSGKKIFLNSTLSSPFPLAVDYDNLKIHKIIVAHGAEDACKMSSSDNIYGSLAITYIDGDDNTDRQPFMIALDRNNPVHVFDSHNLPILLHELDTIADFTSYLQAKELAISKFSLSYCGEEDLLAHYFLNFDTRNNCHYIGSRKGKFDHVMIGEGEWKDFIEEDTYQYKKTRDKISYLWDDLIQKTSQNALDGTLLGDGDIFRRPSAILEMAKEPRFVRRAHSERIIKAVKEFSSNPSSSARQITFLSSVDSTKAYVFLQLRVDSIATNYNEYKIVRRSLLEVACGAARNRFNHLRTVIGIAIDGVGSKYDRGSEDLLYMDCNDWSDEVRNDYESANSQIGFFTSNLDLKPTRIMEFPLRNETVPKVKPTKVGRNELCPCGSGRKYKKCCLSR